MPVTTAPQTDHQEKVILRTDPARGLELGVKGVDRGTATIAGASIMQVGVVKDGRFEIDAKTLKQFNGLANTSKIGLKVRFGHPSMSDDALGTFLGRAKHFRVDPDGTLSRGDIFFDETSFRTPKGDLGGYVLDLATNDPAAFGMSVVVEADREFRLNPDGTRQLHEETGEPLPPLLRIKHPLAVDFVDSPAATNSVFGQAFGWNEQTFLSAEAFQKLSQLAERPDFIQRAYVFFSRAFALLEDRQPHIDHFNKEPTMADEKVLILNSVEELTKHYPGLVEQLKKTASEVAMKAERDRVKQIVELAISMPCDVDKELLEAIDKGVEFSRAESSFLRVELSQRGKEANPRTGLGEDSMPDTQTFQTYDEAWRAIKADERCSTQEAMGRAQDRYPKLYQQFLDRCPRKKK